MPWLPCEVFHQSAPVGSLIVVQSGIRSAMYCVMKTEILESIAICLLPVAFTVQYFVGLNCSSSSQPFDSASFASEIVLPLACAMYSGLKPICFAAASCASPREM